MMTNTNLRVDLKLPQEWFHVMGGSNHVKSVLILIGGDQYQKYVLRGFGMWWDGGRRGYHTGWQHCSKIKVYNQLNV